MTNEYLETMNARALDDCSADPIPDPGQVFTIDGAALAAVPVGPAPEAPHPAFPDEPQITHYVGDGCPGGHAGEGERTSEPAGIDDVPMADDDACTHYVRGECQVSVPADLASEAAIVEEAFALLGCQ